MRSIDPITHQEIRERKVTLLKLMPCSDVPDHHSVKKFSGLSFKNLYCYDDTDEQLELGGVWESPKYHNIDFNLRTCVNTTENGNHCKSPEVIKKNIEGAYLAFHFAD